MGGWGAWDVVQWFNTSSSGYSQQVSLPTAMDTCFIQQLSNCLLLCWVGTEYALYSRAPKLRHAEWWVGGWLLLNIIIYSSHADQVIFPAQGFLHMGAQKLTHPINFLLSLLSAVFHTSFGWSGMASLLCTATVLALVSARRLKQGGNLLTLSKQPKAWGGGLACWAVLWLCIQQFESIVVC